MNTTPVRILVTGQTTMELGRMEWGNVGNYYVVEPFFKELHRVFPGASVRTTLQLSDHFCSTHRVTSLAPDVYCNLQSPSVQSARDDVREAERLRQGHLAPSQSPFITEVQSSDLVIDFSGDIWGQNADLLGEGRFEIGVCRDHTAQILGKVTALMCSSPGPFDSRHLPYAKEVFGRFDLVANRENESSRLLREWGFSTEHVSTAACPAFLYEPEGRADDVAVQHLAHLRKTHKNLVGMVICGFNFLNGPHNRWPRNAEEYTEFLEAAEILIRERGCHIVLLSHSNGFTLPPEEFRHIHGSDFKHAKMMAELLTARGYGTSVTLLEGLYSAHTTKALIGQLELLVSGRIHGAVAGFSQFIPTCVVDYGHEPKAHKLAGFVDLVQGRHVLADPAAKGSVRNIALNCWDSRWEERDRLCKIVPEVQRAARQAFDDLCRVYWRKSPAGRQEHHTSRRA